MLIGAFLVGLPLQMLVARARPAMDHRMTLRMCRVLLRLARVRLEVEGAPSDDRPLLLVANHMSWIDILGLASLAPLCFLAKREVSRWPLVSAFAAMQGTVFVDRLRRRSIPAANRAMVARMLGGSPMLLFPEGTTLAGPSPGPFRSSHFAAARDLLALEPQCGSVSIQPVALSYSRADAAWIDDESLVPHVWRVLRRPPLICRIRFGAPVAFVAGSDRKRVARQAREAVAALIALGAPAEIAGPVAARVPVTPATARC